MNKEDRKLLVRDLCARLPYNTIISVTNDDDNRNTIQYLVEEDIKDLRSTISYSGNIYKPYLFPLSSMNSVQKLEYNFIVNWIYPNNNNLPVGAFVYTNKLSALLHFYNVYHFDYNGLIPKGLALDATGLNIY